MLFGFIMLVSIIRFAWMGWIYDLYISPSFHFSYWGLEWIEPLEGVGMYVVFGVMGLSALGIMLGACYRLSAVVFFLTFTYVELIDKSNYLNHYYFVSIVSFLLIWVPAHRSFSVDTYFQPQKAVHSVPAWNINIIKFQLSLVYVFAGVAKLNPEWLIHAMPLMLWLPARSGLPIIGPFLEYEETAYLFCWFGACYDLFIVFFLLNKYTRYWAYGAVVVFHGMTALLFQIGMFPYIMILATLIFFPASVHQNLLSLVSRGYRQVFTTAKAYTVSPGWQKISLGLITLHIIVQLTLPFRYLLYPGNLFWTEEGYRFSWRVMLMEKAGYVVFHIADPVTGKKEQVRNYDYLTPNQEKMMSTQPDMILQFAHFLVGEYKNKGFLKPQVNVESYVTLNGRRSQTYIDPNVDLALIKDGMNHRSWVLPMKTDRERE